MIHLGFVKLANMVKLMLPPFSRYLSSVVAHFDLVLTILWCPSLVMSLDDYRYYIHFLDDFSRFVWVYPLKLKSDAFSAFEHFVTFVNTRFEATLKLLQLGNGGEYHTIRKLCGFLLIRSRFSCMYTSVQNRRVERKHRHIIETGLSLLAQASMLLKFWWDVFQTATLLINGFSLIRSLVLLLLLKFCLIKDSIMSIYEYLDMLAILISDLTTSINSNFIQRSVWILGPVHCS